MKVLVFDIETIPDAQGGKKLYDLDDVSESDITQKMLDKRRAETDNGSDFMRHHLHKIIAISAVLDVNNTLKIWSLGEENASEKELIQRFFDGIEKYSPVLVSWNGSAFDLPVLHYRALIHGVSGPTYWETGEKQTSFRHNNYLNRYHYRHTDLMEVLSCYQPRATASLNDIAVLLGFPGKLGMDGSQVLSAYQQGEIRQIRQYCETDVLNAYLIYLRFELMRGKLLPEQYDQKIQQVKILLKNAEKPHLQDFLSAWETSEKNI